MNWFPQITQIHAEKFRNPALMQKGDKKIITAWTFYDWANSVYPLTITSAIFPIYYHETIKSSGIDNIHLLGLNINPGALYEIALAFAYLIVAFTAPVLSGIADYSGKKKSFMQFFCYLGSMSCMCMYFFTKDPATLWIGITTVILACVGFSGSLVFYNAYLPEIAEPEQHDQVSARGFAMGYIGSAILLILNLIMVQVLDMDARWCFVSVGIWWIGFAQIPFRRLPNNVYGQKPEGNYLLNGYKELQKVWKQLKDHPNLAKFLSAFFVYNMGVQIIMLVATLFGTDELKMEDGQLIISILLIQFVAIAGAYLFSKLSKKSGNIFTLKSATIIWIGVCIGAYFVYTAMHFYIVAVLVGLVMGGTQSLSRSTYSKMLPETHDHTIYFSYYDVTEKLCIVCGMGLFALIHQVSGSMRNPILALILFFVVGFLLLLRIPKAVHSN